jgi:hypothetical protein
MFKVPTKLDAGSKVRYGPNGPGNQEPNGPGNQAPGRSASILTRTASRGRYSFKFRSTCSSGFFWIPSCSAASFEVNSEPHTRERPSARLCVGLISTKHQAQVYLFFRNLAPSIFQQHGARATFTKKLVRRPPPNNTLRSREH